MKQIILSLLVISLYTSVFGQTEYYLSKAITVGCYGANPLTDMTKKIKVYLEDDQPKFSIASLMCTKEFELMSIGSLVNNESIYYSKKDKRGIILEGDDILYVFKKEEDNFSVFAVAHKDKKTAKTLSAKTGEEKYLESLSQIDKKIGEAELAAEMKAKKRSYV